MLSPRPSLAKRAFDIAASAGALLVLSPVLLLAALAIRLESRGPVFYASWRVGAGYRRFRLFKFRTMYPDADQRLKEFAHLNQYAAEAEAPAGCPDCARLAETTGETCSPPLVSDGGEDGLLCGGVDQFPAGRGNEAGGAGPDTQRVGQTRGT